MGLDKSTRVSGIYDHLSNNMRFLRLIKGLSQEHVSEIVHMSRMHYCRCENGKYVPSLETVCILADFYDVSIDSLISAEISYVLEEPKTKK